MHGYQCRSVQKSVATGAGGQLDEQCGHHSGQLCGEQREAAMRRFCLASGVEDRPPALQGIKGPGLVWEQCPNWTRTATAAMENRAVFFTARWKSAIAAQPVYVSLQTRHHILKIGRR